MLLSLASRVAHSLYLGTQNRQAKLNAEPAHPRGLESLPMAWPGQHTPLPSGTSRAARVTCVFVWCLSPLEQMLLESWHMLCLCHCDTSRASNGAWHETVAQ